MIGRFVDVHAGLGRIAVTCAGLPVAFHQRSWDARQTITDPAHVATAAVMRTAFKEQTAAMRGPLAVAQTAVAVRPLTDYDDLFNLNREPEPASTGTVEEAS